MWGYSSGPDTVPPKADIFFFQSGGGFFRKQMGLTALIATDALTSILDRAIGFLAPHISADTCRYGSCIEEQK